MKHIILYITLTAALFLGSCNDWLDVKPRSEIPAKDLFESEEGFRDALIECYVRMNSESLYGLSMTMLDVEYLAQHWVYYSDDSEFAAWKNFDYRHVAVETAVGNIYAGLYNVIVQANTVLTNLPEHGGVISSQQTRNIIEAEALAVRAFCHLDVLRLFGQVPGGSIAVSLPYAETVSTEPIQYYNFDAFVGKILADITRAQTLLEDHEPLMQLSDEDPTRYYGFAEANAEDDFYSYRRFRFNAYALRAMKARLLLWSGKADNKSAAYREATELITALRDPRQPMPLAGLADINKGWYALPSECIMALSNSRMKSINDTYMSPEYLYQSTETVIGDIFKGHTMTTNNRGQLWNMTAVDRTGSTHPITRKFLQPSTAAASGTATLERALYNEVMPLLRLSEVYLIAIETAPGLAESNALYQTYMEARGELVPNDFFPSREVLMAELLNEYRREFWAEGQMFYAYKRLNTKTMLWKTDREVTERDYIVPLPLSEVNAD